MTFIKYVVLLLMFSSTAFAAYSPAPCLSINGKNFFDCDNLIRLVGYTTNTGRYATVRTGAGTAYQAGWYSGSDSGKRFHVVAAIGGTNSANANPSVTPCYGDTDVAFKSASAPTNPVFVGNDSSDGIAGAVWQNNTGGFSYGAQDFYVPNDKYVCCYNAANASSTGCEIWGYEET